MFADQRLDEELENRLHLIMEQVRKKLVEDGERDGIIQFDKEN